MVRRGVGGAKLGAGFGGGGLWGLTGARKP